MPWPSCVGYVGMSTLLSRVQVISTSAKDSAELILRFPTCREQEEFSCASPKSLDSLFSLFTNILEVPRELSAPSKASNPGWIPRPSGWFECSNSEASSERCCDRSLAPLWETRAAAEKLAELLEGWQSGSDNVVESYNEYGWGWRCRL